MKTTAAIVLSLAASTAAFAPAFSRGLSATKVFSEPADGEEGGLDLNLEEMFDMFDAADKGKDFDDTIKKVKGDGKDEK